MFCVQITLEFISKRVSSSLFCLLCLDILKHTQKSNPDHAALVQALGGLREVMSHINEDKRKTEGQLQMFDIYNDIDQCPVRQHVDPTA